MKRLMSYIAIVILFIVNGCVNKQDNLSKKFPERVKISVESTNPSSVIDAPIIIDISKLKQKAAKFNPKAFAIFVDEKQIPSQVLDQDNDGSPDQILCVADIDAKQKLTMYICYAPSGEVAHNYTKRTQAELSHKVDGKFVDRKYQGGTFENTNFLRVPSEHTDHSYFIRYEGPGWESDKVGYRFYLDWRNAVDIFGKKTTEMVLQDVGQDGFESYHNMADWGMDILKVGNSLGVGSIGMWHQEKANRVEKTDSILCAIKANGNVFSKIQTIYYGWQVGNLKVDLTSNLSIWAGSRLTHCELLLNGQVDNICTGLVKHANTELLILRPEKENEWGYLALWGKQSLAGDDDLLGMAVLFSGSHFDRFAEDDLNHVVILNPDNNIVDYYFLAAWAQEPDGIKTKEAFETYLKQTVSELNHPLKVQY